MDANALAQHAKAFGLALTRTQLEAFVLFERKLYEANARTNLTRVPQAACWARHFLDSLAISPFVPHNAFILDIGSGPGFPGACLAIARPDLRVTCMDSANKAIEFLVRLFSPAGPLPVLFQVVNARAEDASHDPSFRETFDFVTGRAIAPFAVQMEISAAFSKVGGLFVPMRTPKERDEIIRFPSEKLGLQLSELKTVRIAPIGADRMFPIFRKKGKTPKEFPRGWAQIKGKPLA